MVRTFEESYEFIRDTTFFRSTNFRFDAASSFLELIDGGRETPGEVELERSDDFGSVFGSCDSEGRGREDEEGSDEDERFGHGRSRQVSRERERGKERRSRGERGSDLSRKVRRNARQLDFWSFDDLSCSSTNWRETFFRSTLSSSSIGISGYLEAG